MKFFFSFALFLSLSSTYVYSYLDPNKSIAQFGTAQWDHRDGLNSNWISQICQTSNDPSIWMASPTGLVRFNGVSFEVFDIQDSPLFHGGIWALETDQNGRLWIGTRLQGMVYYENGEFFKFTSEDPMSKELPEVRSLRNDSRNWLWIGTPVGLYTYKDGVIEAYDHPAFNDAFITAIHEDDNGDIWIGTQDHGLFHLPIGGNPDQAIVSLLPFNTIYSLSSGQNGDLWVGAKNGLYRIEKDRVVGHLTTADGLPSNSIRALHLDESGTLVIGTESGMIRYFNGAIIEDPSTNPFSEQFITCFYEDTEGSLWIGSKYNGFGQLWTSKFIVYSKPEGLGNPIVNVSFEDQAENLWIGTNEGLYTLQNGQIKKVHEEIFSQARIRDILEDSNGNLWICSYSGLFKIKDGEITRYTVEDGLPSNLVRQILEDSSGRIWIGTRSGLVLLEDEIPVQIWQTPELQNDLILHIFEDAEKNIWIATDGAGIARLENNSFKWFSTELGLANDIVFKIHEDKKGLLWLSTADGISIFDGNSFRNLSLEDGLPSQTVFQIIENSEGYFWTTTYEGIFKLERDNILQYLDGEIPSFVVSRYGPADGLRTYQMTSVGESCMLADGRLCFSTADGIGIIDPNEISLGKIDPEVYFEKLQVNGETYFIDPSNQDPLEFGPGVKSLEIEFTSNSLIGASNVLFATRLIGFDDEFKESSERSVTFTNLDPGDYQFEVRTRNADGIWGDKTGTVAFTVDSYWHQTGWFYLLIISLSMLAGYGLYSIRIFQLRQHRRHLAKRVNERTEEITRQKEIIEAKGLENEKTLRALQASNTELKKLSEEKSYFLGVAAHDMKNPLGAISVLSEELMLDRENLPEGNYEVASLINKSANEMLRLVDTLVHSISLDSGEMKLEKDLGDLVTTANSVIEMNRKPSILKGISLSLECPDQLAASFDSLRIRTAMDNYVSNAIKYTPSGGSVKVSLQEISDSGQQLCEFVVSDSGPGLSDKDFDRVFGRFSKLSARPTGKECSSGLGLSIVKKIIELHGGSVRVENNPDVGASFYFRFPLQ